MTMIHTLFVKLGTALLGLGMVFGFSGAPAVSPSFGSVTPVGGTQYTLAGAGVTSTQTTIPLASFTTPDGRALTMSMFGSIGYGAIDPQTTAKIEDITFSGIVQNANGSATLTGVTRGNDFVTPYAASSTLARSHSGGATFILTNTAGFYTQFAGVSNANTFSGVNTFSSTSPPRYDQPAAQAGGSYIATTSEFASVAYVNAVALSGAPNATTVVKGIVQIATAAQQASSTALGTTGASLALAASNATDTPQSKCNSSGSAAGAGCALIALMTGKLSQSWLDIFSTNNTWTGTQTFSNTATFNGSNVFNGASAFNTLPTGLDWQLVVSTTTSVATHILQATTTTAFARYRVYINIYGYASADAPFLNFNNDYGSNYGSRVSANFAAAVLQNSNTQCFIDENVASTSPEMFTLDIYNPTTSRKFLQGVGTKMPTISSAPTMYSSSCTWNNSSAQITNFELTTGSTFLASSTMQIYGSNRGN